MAKHAKQIRSYIGDDGEFIVPTDDYLLRV